MTRGRLVRKRTRKPADVSHRAARSLESIAESLRRFEVIVERIYGATMGDRLRSRRARRTAVRRTR
jgi:hypothetical protein